MLGEYTPELLVSFLKFTEHLKIWVEVEMRSVSDAICIRLQAAHYVRDSKQSAKCGRIDDSIGPHVLILSLLRSTSILRIVYVIFVFTLGFKRQ